MRRFLAYMDAHFEETILVILATILVVSLTYTAIVRYFLPYPIFTALSHKAEELAIFAFVAQLYFGASLATRQGSHFRVTAQFLLVPEKWRKWCYLPGELLWHVLNAFLVYQGILLVYSAIEMPQLSIALQLPMWVVYAVIPLSFLNSTLRLLQRHCKGKMGPDMSAVDQEI